jgi:hypothetical protein
LAYRVLLKNCSHGCRNAMSDLRSSAIFPHIFVVNAFIDLIFMEHYYTFELKQSFAFVGEDDDVESYRKDYRAASLGFIELLPISSKICSSMYFNIMYQSGIILK